MLEECEMIRKKEYGGPSNHMWLLGKRRAMVLTAVVAVAVLTFVSVAASNTTKASGASSASASAKPILKLSKKKVQLYIYDEIGFPVTGILAKEFHKQFPQVTFKFSRETFQNITTQAPKIMNSSNAPDLIRLPTLGQSVKDGLVANLDPYFKAYKWNTFSAGQLVTMRMNKKTGTRGSGPLWGLGLGYSVTGMFWNKELAKEAGITTVPATLGELQSNLAKIKAKGLLPIQGGAKDGAVTFTVQQLIQSYFDTTKLLNWEFAKSGATINTPAVLKGMTQLQSWSRKGYFPSDINAIDYFGMVGNFENGQGVYLSDGNWDCKGIQAKMGSKAGFFLFPPVKKGGKHVAMGAPNTFAIPAKGKHVAEMAFFLNWVHANNKARKIVVTVTGATPGGPTTASIPKVPKGLIKTALSMSAQVGRENGFVDFIANTTGGIYSGAIIPDNQLLFTDKMSPQEWINSVQAFWVKDK